MIQKMKQYLSGEKGVAYIEFALVLPILLLLFVGGLELTRFVMANQKVDKASHGLANLLSTQEDPLSVGAGVLDGAFDSLLRPFGTSNAGYRVLELRPDLGNEQADGFPLRVEAVNTSGAVGGTQVGNAGAPVTGPDVQSIRIEESEFLVAVEAYLTYESILPGMRDALIGLGLAPPNVDGSQLYKRSVIRHRLANFQLENGTRTNPVTPICCGTYCSDDGQPECACRGGNTCDDSDVALYPLCTASPPSSCNTSGGGGSNCTTDNSCSGGGS